MTEIHIDIDALTWEDMRMILSLGEKSEPADMLKIADMFDRVVVGGAKAVPVMRTREVIDAIGEAMKGLENPKN